MRFQALYNYIFQTICTGLGPVHYSTNYAFIMHYYTKSCWCKIIGDITISGGAVFTVDSDLNGTSSPQFSLTCISTGGPATTVTWTRDSDTVTEGTETVLDNPVTAQYTHTLTVTGRLGGLYTCTVTNDKPSEAMADIAVKGTYFLDLLVECSCL